MAKVITVTCDMDKCKGTDAETVVVRVGPGLHGTSKTEVDLCSAHKVSVTLGWLLAHGNEVAPSSGSGSESTEKGALAKKFLKENPQYIRAGKSVADISDRGRAAAWMLEDYDKHYPAS